MSLDLKRIPNRTPSLELWDQAPVGNRLMWKSEMSRLVGLFATRGRLIRRHRFLVDENGDEFNFDQLAAQLAARLSSLTGSDHTSESTGIFEQWVKDAVLLRGSGKKIWNEYSTGMKHLHYISLVFLNRRRSYDRYWSNFWYWALHTELRSSRENDQFENNAAGMLDQYFQRGMDNYSFKEDTGTLSWSVGQLNQFNIDTESKLILKAVSGDPTSEDSDTVFGSSFSDGIDELDSRSESQRWKDFICPGSVVLMKRSLNLRLQRDDKDDFDSTTQDDIESTLAAHTSDYYLRSMYVVNELRRTGNLPAKCIECRAKFSTGLHDPKLAVNSAGTRENAEWVDSNCEFDPIFANVGPKENNSAKMLATSGLEGVRNELATFTANRRILETAIALEIDIAERSKSDPPPSFADVEHSLLSMFEDVETRRVASRSIRELIGDVLLPDPTLEDSVTVELQSLLDRRESTPEELWNGAVDAIQEMTLSGKRNPVTRSVEVMQSILGGGALPSNEDEKGRIRRGGTIHTPFHLAINDRLLEHMTFIAFAEHKENDIPLTFNRLVEFVRNRFRIEIVPEPQTSSSAPGLVGEAAVENKVALSSRLKNMGVLKEFSDSSAWNRIVYS